MDDLFDLLTVLFLLAIAARIIRKIREAHQAAVLRRNAARRNTPRQNSRLARPTGKTPTVPPLPPRRTVRDRRTRNGTKSLLGPRGIEPEQFPCCPYDKQRNVKGAKQLIFWDEKGNCYCCSRGHRFKSNGKLL